MYGGYFKKINILQSYTPNEPSYILFYRFSNIDIKLKQNPILWSAYPT